MLTKQLADELARLRIEIERGRVAILCGAGISVAPPSSLPLAAGLVQQIISRLLQPYAHSLRSLAIRPEVFFSYLYRQDPRATLDAIRAAVSGDAFNAVHDVCGQIIARGGAVITTNFDLMIEAAMVERGTSFECTTLGCRARRSVLFKIHGSIDDDSSLAFTIDQVGAGLGTERARCLNQVVRDRVVIVLGYSGADQLDIVPALQTSRYERIIWIVHDPSGPWRRTKPPLPDLARLERATFWRGPTGEVAAALAIDALNAGHCAVARPTPTVRQLPDDTKRHVVADILMHEDRYRDVIHFVDALSSAEVDLKLEIRRFEASSSISTRPADWVAQRDRFLDHLFDATPDVQVEFLPTMAKYNHRLDRLLQLRDLELLAMAGGDATEEHVEAAVETLYELIYNHLLADAEKLRAAIAQALDKRPNLLLRGRLLIEQAYLASQRFAQEAADSSLLSEGRKACEEAMFLLGPDICNDPFFLHQARSNLGWLHCLQGDVGRAERELTAARRYFRDVSFNNNLTQWFLLAGLRRAEGKFAQARRLLGRFHRINRDSGRSYWLGFAWREEAICGAALGIGPARIHAQIQASIRHFEAEENQAEADLTRGIAERLLASHGPVPQALFREPAGLAWLAPS